MKDADIEERLRQIQRRRPASQVSGRLGENIGRFMKRRVEPRMAKLAALAAVWEALLPVELAEHTCLEELSRGCLKVLVDSAPHLMELNMLLRANLLEQLRQACPAARVSRVKLERGQWYRTNEQGRKIPTYQ